MAPSQAAMKELPEKACRDPEFWKNHRTGETMHEGTVSAMVKHMKTDEIALLAFCGDEAAVWPALVEQARRLGVDPAKSYADRVPGVILQDGAQTKLCQATCMTQQKGAQGVFLALAMEGARVVLPASGSGAWLTLDQLPALNGLANKANDAADPCLRNLLQNLWVLRFKVRDFVELWMTGEMPFEMEPWVRSPTGGYLA